MLREIVVLVVPCVEREIVVLGVPCVERDCSVGSALWC